MNGPIPKLSIGLPVYNGEKFLAESIESILGQSFSDFELIISDNASTDSTAEICRAYAEKDSRVRYYRSEVNRGAAWNFNNTFFLAGGEYFKWAAHDDVHYPEFLEKCVDVLDRDPSVVLAFTKAKTIGPAGEDLGEYVYGENLYEMTRRRRFLHFASTGHIVFDIFGVIRSDILRNTPLISSYVGSDIVLLGELSLCGGFYQVPECLFLHREHEDRSAISSKDARAYTQWFDTSKSGRFAMPHWRRLFEHARSVFRHRLRWSERAALLWETCRAANWKRQALAQDVLGLLW